MISGFGMFNALVMSYSRLPLAMAQDGMLPKVFGKLHPKSRAPWVAIVGACLLRMGDCLLPRFCAPGHARHPCLRHQPVPRVLGAGRPAFHGTALKRPFRVPGGRFGVIAIGIPPMLLLGFSVFRSQHESILGMSSFAFGMILIAARLRRLRVEPCPEAGGMDRAKAEAATRSIT